ncbi:MAG: hypothetical protein D6728_13880 [Cyanobacteria bacterium J055]|nr:MAG: hypothetical protein D6728_13880 [Cyanobacteria bacterium J055]
MEPKYNPNDRPSTYQVSEIVERVVEFLAEAPSILAYGWKTYRRPIVNVAIVLALLSAIVAIFDFIESVNHLILIPTLFTVLGIVQALRFAYRNVLFAKDRQKLLQQIRSVKKELIGSSSIPLLESDRAIEVQAIAVEEPASIEPPVIVEETAVEEISPEVEAVQTAEDTNAVLVPEEIETPTESEPIEDSLPEVLPPEVAAISVEEETTLNPEPLTETTIGEEDEIVGETEPEVASSDAESSSEIAVEPTAETIETVEEVKEIVEAAISDADATEENKTESNARGFQKKTPNESPKKSGDKTEGVVIKNTPLETTETPSSIASTPASLDDLLFYTNGVDELRYLFLSSQVELLDSPEKLEGLTYSQKTETFGIGVVNAEGTKCERCWNYSTFVGKSSEHPTLCDRCIAALNGKF